MVFQLTKEEVLKVCQECSHYSQTDDTCNSSNESAKPLNHVRKCPKWDDHFGGTCLFRG